MEAAGAYIRAVRDARDMSRADVSRATGIHESQIVRIEAGVQDTGYSSFFALIQAVRADASDVLRLIADPGATAKDASDLADKLVHPHKIQGTDPDLDSVIVEEIEQKLHDGHAEQRLRAAQILEQLVNHRELLNDWLRYGEYLTHKR